MSCCTRASFERGLSCIPRFGHLKCDAGLTSIRLPALSRYICEVALFALCCSCLFIAAPVWIIFLSFVILCIVCLLLYLLANLVLVFVFIFMRSG